MKQQVTESVVLTEATRGSKAGKLAIEFITPGWGSSGYYSQQVVEAALPLFKAGTHMYLDHPTADEATARPIRSVKDLAAVIESAEVDPVSGGIRGIVAPVASYKELLTDETFAKNIGISINGSASDVKVGEAEGRRGPIIESLADISSVDFVTRAGRGGKVLQIMESERFISEATADDRARQLSDVVRASYPDTGEYAWVMDTDAERQVVWYQVSYDNGPSKTFEQTYDVGDNDVDVSLTGSPVEVSRVTKYVPVTRPDSTATTEGSEENTMGNISIDEAEHRTVTEAAGRVPALEAERDTAIRERDEARAQLAEQRRNERASALIAESSAKGGVTFTPLEHKGLLVDLPLTESGELDETRFTATVEAAVTDAKATTSTGRVRGLGESVVTPDATVTEGAVSEKINPWSRRDSVLKGA